MNSTRPWRSMPIAAVLQAFGCCDQTLLPLQDTIRMLWTTLPYRLPRSAKSWHSRSMICTRGSVASNGSNASTALSLVSRGLLTCPGARISDTLVRMSAWYMLALIAAASPSCFAQARAVRGWPSSCAEAFSSLRRQRAGSIRRTWMSPSPPAARSELNSPRSRPASRTRQDDPGAGAVAAGAPGVRAGGAAGAAATGGPFGGPAAAPAGGPMSMARRIAIIRSPAARAARGERPARPSASTHGRILTDRAASYDRRAMFAGRRMHVAALAAALAAGAAAGGAPTAPADPPVERVGRVDGGWMRVGLTATVTDRSGRPVTGLGREDFVVTENDEPVDLAEFGPEEGRADRPLSVAVLLDLSGSMGSQIKDVEKAARALLGGLRPGDEIMVA